MNTENLNTQELEILRTLLNKMADVPQPKVYFDPLNKMIDDIIQAFDFLKVQAAMESLGWRWASSENKIPTTLELRQQAIRLLRGAIKCRLDEYKDEYWELGIHNSTGGFDATAYCNEDKTKITGLKLQFILTEWHEENN